MTADIYIYIMLYYILYYIILLIPRIQGSIQPSCSLSRSIGHRWPNIHHCADHAHVRPPSGQTGRCFFYLISLRLLILFNLLMWNFIATNLTGAFLAMDWARLRLSDNWQSPRTGNGYLGWWGKYGKRQCIWYKNTFPTWSWSAKWRLHHFIWSSSIKVCSILMLYPGPQGCWIWYDVHAH